MLSQVLLFYLISVFPLLLKTLSFFRSPPNLSQKNDDPGFVNRWIIVKFGYVVRNSILNAYTVGICEIIFVEGEKGIA